MARVSRLGLPAWVLIGGVGGILTGLFFGDYCAALRPIGSAYVMLLQAAVYPYIVCSLLHGLGSIRPERASKRFRSGWIFYLTAWIVTFAALFILAQAIPSTLSTVTTASGINQLDFPACWRSSSRAIHSRPCRATTFRPSSSSASSTASPFKPSRTRRHS